MVVVVLHFFENTLYYCLLPGFKFTRDFVEFGHPKNAALGSLKAFSRLIGHLSHVTNANSRSHGHSPC